MTAASHSFSCVLDIRASLGECPLWSSAEQALYWVDINAPSLNRFDPASGDNVAIRVVGESEEFLIQTRWMDRDDKPTNIEPRHLTRPAIAAAAGPRPRDTDSGAPAEKASAGHPGVTTVSHP